MKRMSRNWKSRKEDTNNWLSVFTETSSGGKYKLNTSNEEPIQFSHSIRGCMVGNMLSFFTGKMLHAFVLN